LFSGYLRTLLTTGGKSEAEVQAVWDRRHEWGAERVHQARR
jgi:hypothetical protein